jgi:hypothetical protein
LAARLAEVLGPDAAAPRAQIPEVCIATAESLLRDLLDRPSAGRESALDLLTVDALVTYAFEAASDDPARLSARAEDAMRRLSAVARE